MTRRAEATILATCVIPWDDHYRFLERSSASTSN